MGVVAVIYFLWCCGFEKKGGLRGGLLYFRGGCEGRVKVACRLLYSIFK